MTALLYADPDLIFALNRKVIFVNPNDLQIFKEIELPADLRDLGLKTPKSSEEEAATRSEQSKKPKEVNIEEPSILHVKLSPDRQLCAVTTSGQKAVLLYQCRPEHAKLISVRPLARASSALTFNKDSNILLVTDKSGDCYKYDCVELEDEPRLLLGHLSIVYDVLWTPDNKYIITCDRDDKIRVTNYPATHDIHGYCLGHKEFVSGLALLDKDTIVSVSGDKTLRIWDFITGRELSKMELPAPALRICLRSIDKETFQAAVVLYQPDECIGIYEIRKSDAEEWKITEQKVLRFPKVIISNICFVGERLYAAGVVEDRFTLKISTLSEKVPQAAEKWITMIEEQFKTEEWKPEDVSAWFKKRYDNVSDYLERKKRRIEEKQK
ncbi:PREDICTED: tRNA (guanine-N(7)-)-methyltransferase non-catalytic subunit wuho [Rhagoletis zephyria]|uniref:tRNA (guanine-N(7)-)-methyltransferase non-catalytic subunit wuho n=1 Tax=Rhagoletis zephyria TaxID=28612 RepID=UPI0008116D85|nr:PREDICTED: tRNA (guanine-N(7)-)-methyltransferase non-catalytic subunit wuho [Rhagoletis zephyria]